MTANPVLQTDYNGLSALIDEVPANRNVYIRLDYLWDREARKETHFLALDDTRKIVAAGSVRPDPNAPDELWLTHISVDRNNKNQGHGKRILGAIFKYAAQNGYTLAPSRFKVEGFSFLAPLMPRFHAANPDLKIRYQTPDRAIVDGHRSYTLHSPNGIGSLAIEFK